MNLHLGVAWSGHCRVYSRTFDGVKVEIKLLSAKHIQGKM